MKIHPQKLLLKTLKIAGITLGSILLLMFLLPVLFPKTITEKIKQVMNQKINGQVNFSSTSLSFFKRFPELTLTLEDFSLKGSAPFQQDTLISLTYDMVVRDTVAVSTLTVSRAKVKNLSFHYPADRDNT